MMTAEAVITAIIHAPVMEDRLSYPVPDLP
jgi:hypothetical protein